MKYRNYLFDNLKFFLIILVVIGHFIDPYVGYSNVLKNMFFFIYSFHMPLFIFVTGYFSKGFYKNKNVKANKIITYIILYLLIIGVEYITGDHSLSLFGRDTPAWYLLATTIWLVLIPITDKIKPSIMLIVSFIIGICSGYDASIGDFMALSRVLVFYPFFLLGYYTTEENIKKLTVKENILPALIFILIIILIVFNNDFNIYRFRLLVTGRNSFKVVGLGLSGGLYRFIYYIFVPLIGMALIILTPKKKMFFTKLGERTLQVYVLHYFVYILFNKLDLFNLFRLNVPYFKISIIIFAIILTIILSLKLFELPFKWLLNLKYKFIYKKSND